MNQEFCKMRDALLCVKEGPSREDLAQASVLEQWSVHSHCFISHVNYDDEIDARKLTVSDVIIFFAPDFSYARTLSQWHILGNRVSLEAASKRKNCTVPDNDDIMAGANMCRELIEKHTSS